MTPIQLSPPGLVVAPVRGKPPLRQTAFASSLMIADTETSPPPTLLASEKGDEAPPPARGRGAGLDEPQANLVAAGWATRTTELADLTHALATHEAKQFVSDNDQLASAQSPEVLNADANFVAPPAALPAGSRQPPAPASNDHRIVKPTISQHRAAAAKPTSDIDLSSSAVPATGAKQLPAKSDAHAHLATSKIGSTSRSSAITPNLSAKPTAPAPAATIILSASPRLSPSAQPGPPPENINAQAETLSETAETAGANPPVAPEDAAVDQADMEVLSLEDHDILVRLDTDQLGRIDLAVSLDDSGISAEIASEQHAARDSIDSALAQRGDTLPHLGTFTTAAWSDRRQPPPQPAPPSETERSATPRLPDSFTHRLDRKPPGGTVHVYA